MRPFIIIVLSILTTVMAGCKQNEMPAPVEETPAVWVECEVNGIPFKMEAGENAVYATAIANDFDSNKREYIFKIDAPALKKSIQVSVYNYKYQLGDLYEDLDSTIKPGPMKFLYTNQWPFFVSKPMHMVLIYKDYDKNLAYYTVPVYQDSTSYFEIVSVKDVVNNGKRFKVAEIHFSCRVLCPDNSWVLWIRNGRAFIPFGQK